MSSRFRHPVPEISHQEAYQTPRGKRNWRRKRRDDPLPADPTRDARLAKIRQQIAHLEDAGKDKVPKQPEAQNSPEQCHRMEVDEDSPQPAGDPHVWDEDIPQVDAADASMELETDYEGEELESEKWTLDAPNVSMDPKTRGTSRRTEDLYARWTAVLSMLVSPFLAYQKATEGQILEPVPMDLPFKSNCLRSTCRTHQTNVICLFLDHLSNHPVIYCDCESVPSVLIRHGLFASAPSQPREAFSVHLLDWYKAFFERSSDAINALSHALNTFYYRRGFMMKDSQGRPIGDPFRRSLSAAVLWYNNLLTAVERSLAKALAAAEELIQKHVAEIDSAHLTNVCHAHCILRQRCPACFARETYGTSFDLGGDIHVAVDGNFNHRHLARVGDVPKFYDPEYILPKAYVDDIGRHIEQERPRAKPGKSLVPDEAIQECDASHESGTASTTKTDPRRFDDTGLMALVCRHDIPLFAANIDTPGEKHKYAIALIKYLMSLLPENAMVVVLYDVGCVLDRSVLRYDLFDDEALAERLQFTTNAMHAYAHQWSCQIVYNPRLYVGMALTDGEGVERLWSRMRKLIGILRNCLRSRRIWTLDRQLIIIGFDMVTNLGEWISRKFNTLMPEHQSAAQKVLDKVQLEESYLREQWQAQKDHQLSQPHHAPNSIKRELDSVLVYQTRVDRVQEAMESIEADWGKSSATSDVKEVMGKLRTTSTALNHHVDDLFSSINIQARFPQLANIGLEFLRHLFVARELKISIRSKAIGTFFEYERLDQAVGGKHSSIGTKLHQATRDAISKRMPTLRTAIQRFNVSCERLKELHRPEWTHVAVPNSLPDEIAALRESEDLLQDVWISPSENVPVPEWISNPNVRKGISALLKTDRCKEEQKRLEMEAANLRRWLKAEVAATEIALALPANAELSAPLQQNLERLLEFESRWEIRGLTSSADYRLDIQSARDIARAVLQAEYGSSVCSQTRTMITVTGDVDDSGDDAQAYSMAFDMDMITDAVSSGDDEALRLIMSSMNDSESAQDCMSIQWELPFGHCDQEDLLDSILIAYPAIRQLPAQVPTEARYLKTSVHHENISFDEDEIEIMCQPTSCLNDLCINQLGKLLIRIFSSYKPTSMTTNQCALFQTYDLTLIRQPRDDTLWRSTQHLRYWDKDKWILPVFRPGSGMVGHWVACVILPRQRTIHLFDSYASKEGWQHDIESIVHFAECLEDEARAAGNEVADPVAPSWTAYSSLLSPRQSNTVDCGLWLLAYVVAVLNGYTGTAAIESDMDTFRLLLLHCIWTLPCRPSTS